MLSGRIAIKNQPLIGASLFVLAVCLAWELSQLIVNEDIRSIAFIGVAFAGMAVAVATFRNWRTGFYLFFIWMMFEDLVRKYMGNNLALFFGKDALLALVYIAFYLQVLRRREKTFRPPFLLALSFFLWLGILQIFNQNSPHILYGLLGFKVYFYYIPLLFVGYALIRTDAELRKFLLINAVLAGIIASLGIVQAILGNTFLNPANLAPDLQELGNLSKVSPITGQILSLPDSVFVSSGRFSEYLIWAFILVLGTAAYFLFNASGYRKLVFGALGALGVATLLSGSRSALIGVAVSALILCAGFLRGVSSQRNEPSRLIREIRRSFMVIALAVVALVLVFPDAAGSRIAFYAETLDPSSSAYEGASRGWDYPITNLMDAFKNPNWLLGNGIGTASLGGQYVAKVIGARPLNIGVEEGYGQLIIEMGILAPFLWIAWTAALLYFSWKVVEGLRDTRLFPIGLAIVWFAFLLLYVFTYLGLAAYENYISNVYLWLLVGILFRLPDLLSGPAPEVVRPHRAR